MKRVSRHELPSRKDQSLVGSGDLLRVSARSQSQLPQLRMVFLVHTDQHHHQDESYMYSMKIDFATTVLRPDVCEVRTRKPDQTDTLHHSWLISIVCLQYLRWTSSIVLRRKGRSAREHIPYISVNLKVLQTGVYNGGFIQILKQP